MVWLTGAASALLVDEPLAQAETLPAVLAHIYHTNPTITGTRAGVRALDEGVPIARSAGLPSLGANLSYDHFPKQSANRFIAPDRAGTASLTMEVPIFSGGLVRNSVRAAEARIRAGRSDLRSTEANLFTEAVAAYMDVVKARAVLELNESNVRALETNLLGAQLRLRAGEATRTDVAQSEARLEQARGRLATATSDLAEIGQEFHRITGKLPTDLEPPPPLPPLPETPDAAARMALGDNPALDAARHTRMAAAHDVEVAAAARYPRISGYATADYSNYFGSISSTGVGVPPNQRETSAAVGLRMNVPLFQGGLPGARVREAQARESQLIEQTTALERAILAEARSAHFRYRASLIVIETSQRAIASNQLALEGVRAENNVGLRNILDVLNAELELLNSQVALVTARRDSYVAGFTLLATVGQAEAIDLGLPVDPYDPLVNYERVRNSINDWARDAKPQPIAVRTAEIEGSARNEAVGEQ